MDFLTPYTQVDQPRRHYAPPANQPQYTPPPVEPAYYNDDPFRPPTSSYLDSYDQPPSPRRYTSTPSPYMEQQNYAPPPPLPLRPPPPSSYSQNEGSDNPRFKPNIPGFIEGYFNHKKPTYSNDDRNNKINNYVSDGVGLVGPNLGFLTNKPSYKMYCKAGGERFAVGIRDGKLVLTRPNSSDLTQNWCKDERYSTKVKDEERQPSFILVNKATGQAVKHSVIGYPVQLTPYKPDVLNESVMWTESKDMGYGFRTIRTVNNISLVMDAWNADKDHGGIRDGTVVAVYKCWKGDNQNQQWKLLPSYCKSFRKPVIYRQKLIPKCKS